MPTYSNIRYDVWGNEDDGFEVNDTRSHGEVDVHLAAPDEVAVRAAGYSEQAVVSGSDEGLIEFEQAGTGRPLGRLATPGEPARPTGKAFARVILEASMRDRGNRHIRDGEVRSRARGELTDVVLEFYHEEPATPGEMPRFFVGIRDSVPESRSREQVDFFDSGIVEDLEDNLVGSIGVDAMGNEVVINRRGIDERLNYLMVALDRWFETGGQSTTEMRWA